MAKETHDLIIVGAGPAGISAAIYAARYKIDFALIGRMPGGNMTESYDVENYPSLEETTPGHVIADRMIAQLERFGQRPKVCDVNAIEKVRGGFKVTDSVGKIYEAKTVILALGMERNRLNIPGESEFEGRGVAYCATCDGFFYKDKVVAVVGGGDSAATAALYLADIAEKVYLIARGTELRAEPTWQEKLKQNKKIKVYLETNIKEIIGTDKVEKIVLDKKNEELKLDGVFIEIGQTPNTALTSALKIKTTDKGLIVVKENQRTSVKGVWAAGDITTESNGLRQIVTAAAEGAVAAVDVFTELKKMK